MDRYPRYLECAGTRSGRPVKGGSELWTVNYTVTQGCITHILFVNSNILSSFIDFLLISLKLFSSKLGMHKFIVDCLIPSYSWTQLQPQNI